MFDTPINQFSVFPACVCTFQKCDVCVTLSFIQKLDDKNAFVIITTVYFDNCLKSRNRYYTCAIEKILCSMLNWQTLTRT